MKSVNAKTAGDLQKVCSLLLCALHTHVGRYPICNHMRHALNEDMQEGWTILDVRPPTEVKKASPAC